MPGAEAGSRVVVLDASVAVRWLVPEPGSGEAAALLQQAIRWIAPSLILAEIAAALRRKVVDGELLAGEALQSFEVFLGFVADGTIRVANDEDVMRAALLLALSLAHRVPDCAYLALAERERIGLVTADRRLGALAEGRGVPTAVLSS